MQLAAEQGFSGVVAVSHGDDLLLAEGYGDCIRESATPCTVDAVFDIGSLTKQFTAAAVMSLVDAGMLSVDDPLSAFFPSAPADKADITIHQLLTHTAGLPDILGDDYDPIDREAFLDLVFQTPLVTPPGDTHAYSNVGYSVLGAIVETTTASSYDEALRALVLDDAGLERTGYLIPDWSSAVVAHGYEDQVDFGSPLDHPWDVDGPYFHLRANGGILSTAPDMMLWHQALLGTTVLSEASKTAMFTPYVEELPGGDTFYGYGWVVEDTTYGKLVWHNGGNDFFFADFWRYLDANVTVFVASNAYAEYAGNDDLARVLATIVLNGR
jgi:CubicO group peptidase (beta-lactamase class C family)